MIRTVGLFYEPILQPIIQEMTQRIREVLGQNTLIDLQPFDNLSPQLAISYDYLIVRSVAWNITDGRQMDEDLPRLAKAVTPRSPISS